MNKDDLFAFWDWAKAVVSSDRIDQVRDYFFSVYENTLVDLALFCLLLWIIFFLRNVRLHRRIKRARKRLPFVVGGWGTRGKSSVERLKAGFFNALGYGVLSKTTGCEAMFLHAHPFCKLREMFLFRPYDKATIWEQHHLTEMAHHLSSEVFLWECMGLTPAYVKILQREWMKDDISTITNTYPDHEDIQGPAGYNIPEVMTCFIPHQGVLVTTEEQMLPILSQAAGQMKTSVHTATWLEAGLLTHDILGRFPYEEHPYNVALVLKLAERLGVEQSFVLKEMADRVVPDIGMLKIYPVATVQERQLEFVSGMSANERFGALSNWERTGFARHSLDESPDIWITTVVNNRADRIPRSKVFAQILAEDISADRHILIGSNLTGLIGYINEAWDDFITQKPLSSGRPEEQLKQMANRLRIPTCETDVKARLKSMLQGHAFLTSQGIDPEPFLGYWNEPKTLEARLTDAGISEDMEEMISWLKQDLRDYQSYIDILNRISDQNQATPSQDLEKRFRDQSTEWFQRKIIVIWNFHTPGSQIIQTLIDQTPPGMKNRIMMLQNIKGTGLDFVYTWQAWDRCWQICQDLKSRDSSVIERGIRELSTIQDYNLLCENEVLASIAAAKKSQISQTEKIQAELAMISSNLTASLSSVKKDRQENKKQNRMMPVFNFLEAFLDAGDAVKRRKIANQIYKDLANQRISHERAAKELKRLNKRQKGGWLYERVHQFVP